MPEINDLRAPTSENGQGSHGLLRQVTRCLYPCFAGTHPVFIYNCTSPYMRRPPRHCGRWQIPREAGTQGQEDPYFCRPRGGLAAVTAAAVRQGHWPTGCSVYSYILEPRVSHAFSVGKIPTSSDLPMHTLIRRIPATVPNQNRGTGVRVLAGTVVTGLPK